MKSDNSQQIKKEIYLQNVAERWKSELNTDKKIYILSPYITSKIEDILENIKKPKDCEIYTTFEIENFIFGSSCLLTLKNLVEKRFNVYSIPQLHAKIVLISDTFVSIGSQNLTNQGTKNKEATFTSTSLEVVSFVEKEIEKWIKDSKTISLEIIKFLEAELEPLKKKQRELQKSIENIEESVKQIEINEQRETNILILKYNLRRSVSRRNNHVRGEVKKLGNNETFVPDFKYKNQLLKWYVNDTSINLEKSYRYLTLIENSGKLGWAKVNNNQITFFGQTFTSPYPLKIVSKQEFGSDETSYTITFTAHWDEKTLSNYNLEISIETPAPAIPPHQRYCGCRINAWFDLKHLRINFTEIKFSDLFGLVFEKL